MFGKSALRGAYILNTCTMLKLKPNKKLSSNHDFTIDRLLNCHPNLLP